MAYTISRAALMHSELYSIQFTANDTVTIDLPDKCIHGISWTSDGVDGGGTLTWNVSNDGSNFNTLGVNTSTDPANPTTITSATAAGNWSVHEHDWAYKQLQFVLSGSTTPTLNVKVRVMFH